MATPVLTIPYPTDAPATGGDSLTQNLNLYYQSGDMSFIIISTAMVWFMVPGQFSGPGVDSSWFLISYRHSILLLWSGPA